nr:endoglucanase [Streptomyces sp. SID5476]
MSNASGGTDGPSVPARFRDDQLATMEARYDGSNAGPASRTSFQQWDSGAAPR